MSEAKIFVPKKRRHPDREQEKRLAKSLGGRRTPGSGSKAIKGDVQTRDELVEAKTTAKSQYTLKLEDLQKLERQALGAGKRPVLAIELNNQAKVDLLNREWVLIPRHDYEELRDGRQREEA